MHPIEPYAQRAYALGWAASGGPMTDRVSAGSAAAVAHAIEHEHDPHVLEATLRLGHLEGVWAAIYDRRTKLYEDQVRAVMDAWRALVAAVDLSPVVRAVRHQAGLAEAKRDETTAAYATALILSLLQGLMLSTEWIVLRSAVSHALTSGAAEGEAGAMALLADKISSVDYFDFDAAFIDAYNGLGAASPFLASVDTWLGQLMNLVAQNAGSSLAQSIADGDNYDGSLDALDAALSDPNRTTAYYLDYLIHLAISAGILWWYRLNGVANVWVITAGDHVVCPICDGYEANSPYSIANVPEIPAHSNCRCSLWTDDTLSASLVDAYL